MQRLTVTVRACPNEQYRERKPDPTWMWPTVGGIELRLVPAPEETPGTAGAATSTGETQPAAGEATPPGKEASSAAGQAQPTAGQAQPDPPPASPTPKPKLGTATFMIPQPTTRAEQSAADTGSADDDEPDDDDTASPGKSGEKTLLTNKAGVAGDDIEKGNYRIELAGDSFAGWKVWPENIMMSDDPVDEIVKLYPPDQKWLLPLKLRCYDDDGNQQKLPPAEVAKSADGTVSSDSGGRAYAVVSLGDVTLTFKDISKPRAGSFKPQVKEIHFFVSETPMVEIADIFYSPVTEAETSGAAEIVIVPTVKVRSNEKSAPKALIGAIATITDTTPGPSTIGSQTKVLRAGKEIRFDNLPPAPYQVTVKPSAEPGAWPIKEKKLDLGTLYPRPEGTSPLKAEFNFEEITVAGRLQTSDNRLVEQDVHLEIYGDSGRIQRLTVTGGTFSLPLDCGAPAKLGLALNGDIYIDGDIPLVPQATEQAVLLPPGVNVVVFLYKYSITGQAVDESGAPAPGAIMDVFDHRQKGPVGSAVAGPDGSFVIGTKEHGEFYIAPRLKDGATVKHQLVTIKPIGD